MCIKYFYETLLPGEGGSVILWDAAARKSKWSHVLHGEIVNCVTVSTVNGKLILTITYNVCKMF